MTPSPARPPAGAPGRGLGPALLCLTLLGAAVRLVHLDGTLGFDEVETVRRYVEGGPPTIFASHGGYGSTNNHLLNSLFAWSAACAFGLEVWALRLPSFAFGVLVVPLTALVALSLTRDRASALVAALLAALSPLLVSYSPACRGYSLLAFFALASTWLLLRVAERGELGKLPWLALAVFAGGWSHMSGLVFAAAAAGFLLLLLAFASRPDDPLHDARGPVRLALGAVVVAGLALTLWYSRESLILRDVQSRLVHGTFVDPSLAGLKSVHAEEALLPWIQHTGKKFFGTSGPLLVLSLPVALAGLVLAVRRDPRRGALLLCAVSFPPLAFLAGDLKPYPRYFLFVQPFVLVAVAVALAGAGRALGRGRPAATAAATALVAVLFQGLSLPLLLANLQGSGANVLGIEWDVAAASEDLAARVSPGDVVTSFPLPAERAEWSEWAFSKTWSFHEELTVVPRLEPLAGATSATRTVWYATPEASLGDVPLLPAGCRPTLVAEHHGAFLYRDELQSGPLSSLDLPPYSAADAWTLDDPFDNVALRLEPDGEGDASACLLVGHAGGEARLVSPAIPLDGELVELAVPVAAEQSQGMRPCAAARLTFHDATGSLCGEVTRVAPLWEERRPSPGRSTLWLRTLVPRNTASVRVALGLAPANPAGTVVRFGRPILLAGAAHP